MALEIYINDEKLDLDTGATIAITKQVADIKQLNVIKAELTNTVTVPYTDTNKRILENAQLVFSTTGLPYTRIPCRVLQNSIELIGKGYAVIDESADAYKLTVYSGNIDWATDLLAKTLREVDYTDKVHTITTASVAATHTAPNGVYVYPPVKWAAGFGGFVSPSGFQYWRPFVYVKELINRIFAGINYTAVGDLFNDPLFTGLILECNRQQFATEWLQISGEVSTPRHVTRGTFTTPSGFVYSKSGLLVFPDNQYDPLQPYQNTPQGLIYQGVTTAPASEPTTSILLPYVGKYTFKMTLLLDIQSAFIGGVTVVNPPVQIQGPASLQFIGLNTNKFNHLESKTVEFTIDNATPNTAFNFNFLAIGQSPGFFNSIELDMLPGCKIELTNFDGNVYLNGGATQPINLAWQMPDFEQLEFVKNIAFMFGCAIVPDIVNKTVEFVSWDKVQENIPLAVDWSRKLDTNKKPSIKYRLDGWAQVNNFKYTPDPEGFVTEGFGDSFINISDAWLPLERDVIELPFSATELITEGFPLIIRQSAPFTWDREAAPRILTTHVDSNSIVIDNALTVSNFINGYFIKSEKPSIGWANRLIPDYFNTVELFIENPKIVEAEFLLEPTDIQNFQPFVPVYIDTMSAYFYVNKITNWVKGKTCKVELIRL